MKLSTFKKHIGSCNLASLENPENNRLNSLEMHYPLMDQSVKDDFLESVFSNFSEPGRKRI